MAANILKQFNGDRFVYIGESRGGCTADNTFFEILNSNWTFVESVDIPQWDGIHDEMNMWKRKT